MSIISPILQNQAALNVSVFVLFSCSIKGCALVKIPPSLINAIHFFSFKLGFLGTSHAQNLNLDLE